MSEASTTFDVPSGLPDIVTLGIQVWGEPTKRKPTEVRFGKHESKLVRPAPVNTWYDHEEDQGGGYCELYKLKYGAMPDRPGFPIPPGMAKELGEPVAWWDYQDKDGNIVARVVRFHPPGQVKTYRQCRPDGDRWRWKMNGMEIPLYHLTEILKAEAGSTVFITEGEKHADQLRAWGLLATTNAGGAKKFQARHAEALKIFDCVVLPDNDEAGRKHRDVVMNALAAAGCDSIRVVELPDLPEKGDIIDWVQAGGTADLFLEIVARAPKTSAGEAEPKTQRTSKPAVDDLITEGAVADAFTAIHRSQLRFDHTAGRWFLWDGTRWRREETRIAYRWAHDIAKSLAADAASAKAIIVAGKASFAGGVERLAQSDRAFAVVHEVWDRDPWLLGTPGGIVSLTTGRTRPARPEDFITKLTAIAPSDEADCPLWLNFLKETTGDDQKLIGFLQRWFGYCLTGITREHALLFVHGDGGNGKGVTMNTVFAIMGDYAANAAMDSFVVTRGDKHTTDLAMLAGARMVMTTEVEEGQTWAEARIKTLTGGDPITARFMRQDNFTFTPRFKLTVSGNHKPALKTVDNSTRRRFNIVPFTRKPAKPDDKLPEKLMAEWPGILRWMVDGCLEWQQFGLNPPPVVVEATAEYFDAQDYYGRWLDECCIRDKNLEVKPAILLRSFQDWCRENGEEMTDNRRLRGMLEKTPGIHHVTNRGARAFRGIGLKPPSGGAGVQGGAGLNQ